MRKYLLALILVLFMTSMAFADSGDNNQGAIQNNPNNSGIQNTGNSNTFNQGGTVGNVTATGGSVGNVTGNSGTISATGIAGDVNQNPNQSMSNNAKQTVLFKTPTQLLNLPSQGVPELNFGNGRMIDATKTLPNFAIYGIKALGAEAIREVLSVNANVKFKKLYQAILDDAKSVANGGKKTLADVRYQVIRAEGQKSWTTGGNLGGGGSALSSSGLSGASGAGSIIPQWGGTKSDDLFTIIFLKVVP